jgi:transposase-like protein
MARDRSGRRDFGVVLERSRGPPSFARSEGPSWLAPVLIVAVPRRWVGPMLRVGVGPALSAGMRCPVCAGGLGPWGGYRRRVRVSRVVFRLLVRRARCEACERTHALLPGFLLARRLDVVDVVGCALEMAASGWGYRPIAAALGRKGTTVRSWLRRLRARVDVLRGWFVGLAVEMAEAPPRAPPGRCSALGLLVGAIADAFLAARLRLGPGAVRGGVWAFCSAATTGGLLSNTSVL